jgi:signal transduction histidine kinase
VILAEDAGETAAIRERLAAAIDDLDAIEIAAIDDARRQVTPGTVAAIVVGSTWLSGAHDLRELAQLVESRVGPLLLLTAHPDVALARRALVLGIEDVVDWDGFVGPRVRTAIALCTERQRLRHALDRAHRRAANLHAICTGLAVVSSELEVASAILDGVALFGAVASTILLRDSDELVLLHARGRATHTVNRFTRLAISARDNPASEAARTSRPVWLDSHADLIASYGTDHGLEVAGTRCSLPLISGADLIGILAIALPTGSILDSEDRIALESLAAVCAQAVERARVYEDMRERVAMEHRLLGIVAEDLRAPLNVVATAVAAAPSADDRQMKALRRIQRAAAQAARMVNELVDYSAGSLGNLALQPATQDLFRDLAACVDSVRTRGATRRIVLTCTGDGVGRFDRARLVLAVANLITNAIAYGDVDEPIHVRAETTAERLYIEVHNRGPVIAAATMAILFHPMKRAAASGRGHLGLGLYITKRIAEAHGGRIWVRSDAIAGTSFVLEIPRAGPPASRVREGRTAPRASRASSNPLPIVVPEPYRTLLARTTDPALHGVLLRWLALGGDQYPPHPRRMEDAGLVPFLPDITIVAIEPGGSPDQPVFRHIDVGGALERRLGHGLLGKPIQEPAGGDSGYEVDMRAAYLRCYLQRAPVYDYLRFRRSGPAALFERIIVPCSRTGGATITDLYAVARFSELPDEHREMPS